MIELEKLWFAGPVSEQVQAFSTLRGRVQGGKPYSQVNLCDYVGDDALRVLDARITLSMQLGVELDDLIMPRQTHSCRVAVIVPLILVDEAAGLIAAAHAGWRGTAGRIAGAVVDEMCRMGARADHIQVAMGPSICQDCFEVGDEVVEAFGQAGFNLEDMVARNPATGRAHIDLRMANREVLVRAGVPAGHIALSQHCSRCEHERYFSARRLGIGSGRTLTAVLQH